MMEDVALPDPIMLHIVSFYFIVFSILVKMPLRSGQFVDGG